NGVSQGAITSYTFNNVTSDGTISASFNEVVQTAIYINAGGEQVTTQDGRIFIADANFSGGFVFPGPGDNITKSILGSTDFANTIDDELFRSERSGSNMSYNVPVPNGDYVVDLYFAEIYFGFFSGSPAPGYRIFDVNIEGGAPEIIDLDFFDPATGGAFESTTGIVKSFLVTVTDGVLNINMSASIDNAKLSALCIRSAGTPNAAPSIQAIGNISINAGNTASTTITASDDIGVTEFQIQVIDAANGNEVSSNNYAFSFAGNTANFDWPTSGGDVGNYLVTVLAFDGADVSSANFTIAVNNANLGNPTIDPGSQVGERPLVSDEDREATSAVAPSSAIDDPLAVFQLVVRELGRSYRLEEKTGRGIESLTIYGLFGQQMGTYKYDNLLSVDVPTEGLLPGTYLLIANGGAYRQKLLIVR
ncbi:MAG: malectin domain-containing carbohydrate-binding protein, partial [Bacteroidota bacterium]